MAENFKPGALAKYGLDYASLAALDDRLIYVSCKGFLPGPYERRTALDEVVQMMGGLAYMTGRPGDPLRPLELGEILRPRDVIRSRTRTIARRKSRRGGWGSGSKSELRTRSRNPMGMTVWRIRIKDSWIFLSY